MKEIEQLQEQINELVAVRSMCETPGWVIVRQHFIKVIKATQDALCIEKDFNEIIRLQERNKSFRAMLETVQVFGQQLNEAVARLDSVTHDRNERDEYGLESLSLGG